MPSLHLVLLPFWVAGAWKYLSAWPTMSQTCSWGASAAADRKELHKAHLRKRRRTALPRSSVSWTAQSCSKIGWLGTNWWLWVLHFANVYLRLLVAVGTKTCLQEAKARRLLQRRLQLSCFDQENAVWIEGVGAVPGMKWWNWNVMIELVRSEIKHEGWTDSDAFSLKRFGPLWQSQLKVLTDQLFVSIAIWKHL